jgi:hypothetical protein
VVLALDNGDEIVPDVEFLFESAIDLVILFVRTDQIGAGHIEFEVLRGIDHAKPEQKNLGIKKKEPVTVNRFGQPA